MTLSKSFRCTINHQNGLSSNLKAPTHKSITLPKILQLSFNRIKLCIRIVFKDQGSIPEPSRNKSQFFKLYVFWIFFLITVAAQSKTWTVYARSNIGVIGSNPTRGLVVCAFILCLCCPAYRYCSCPAMGRSPVQGVVPTVYRLRNWKSGQGPTKGCRAIDRKTFLRYIRLQNPV
jgi:hypothetical protein